MSRVKHLTTLLESLEKKEFDKIVKIYLKKEFGYEKIVSTDGPYDGGIDIKVFDFDGQKIQFQLATQKATTPKELLAFEKKLKEDLVKAVSNCTDYDYKDKLIFFFSQSLTNTKIRELEKMAFKDYNINLELIEARRLAEESENIIEIQTELYKLAELDTFNAQSSAFDNSLFFDLLSFGKPTEFKIQVIDSFILQLFHNNQNGLTKSELIKACETKFEVKENEVFYDRLLAKFQTDGKIKKDKTTEIYTLTNEEKKILRKKNDEFALDKAIFVRNIKAILAKEKQETEFEEYIAELKQLYVDNFSTDLRDVLANDEKFQIFGVFKGFKSFINKKVKNEDKATCLAKELLRYCLSNKFIQKVAASKVYCSKIDNNRLESYLNNKKKIFIDTPVALHALCFYYLPKSNYDNYFYKIAKNLIQFVRKERIKLYMPERYIRELQDHVKDAFNIIPFTKIPDFEKLGSSRNVFYTFYKYLKAHKEIDDEKSFSQFLKDFGFVESAGGRSINSIVEGSLSNINIHKQILPKEYDIHAANDLFEIAEAKFYRNKGSFSRNNDSIMVEYLADKDVDVHPLEPVFVTWDKTFFDVHSSYFAKFPHSQKWLILTPNKMIDVYALLKFSINSETVTENLLALISDDIITNTHSLIDTLTHILNAEDEVGLAYANRLAKIRESEINKVNNEELIVPDNYEGEAVIDDIVYNLSKYYDDRGKRSEKFKKIFLNKDLIESVSTILLSAINDFYETKKISQKLYTDFDVLVLGDGTKK